MVYWLPLSISVVLNFNTYNNIYLQCGRRLLPCRSLWIAFGQFACHHVALAACVICFLIVLVLDCFLLIDSYPVFNSESFGIIISYDFYFVVYCLLLSVSVM